MQRISRRILWGLLIALLCGAVGVLIIEVGAKRFAERRIRSETGLEAQIGSISIGVISPTVYIRDFTLYSTPEFGRTALVQMPELYVEYDRSELWNHRLHFKEVRLNLTELGIVQGAEGRFIFPSLEKKDAPEQGSIETNTVAGTKAPGLQFAGIDTLQLSFQALRLGTLGSTQETRIVFGITNEVFHNLRSQKDLQAVVWVLATKGGGELMGGLFGEKSQGRKP